LFISSLIEVRKVEQPKQLKDALEILRKITEDRGIPRNIRRAASESIEILMNSSMSLGLRAANAISKLDEISTDPNAPLYARTMIWQAIALLEQLKD